jgi:hypothetical protein
MKRQRKVKLSEEDVRKQVTDWLTWNDFFWFYCPNRGRFDTSRDKVTPGAPDIIVVHDGQITAIELKATYRKQSLAQITFQDKLEAAGGTYIVAYSIDDIVLNVD